MYHQHLDVCLFVCFVHAVYFFFYHPCIKNVPQMNLRTMKLKQAYFLIDFYDLELLSY